VLPKDPIRCPRGWRRAVVDRITGWFAGVDRVPGPTTLTLLRERGEGMTTVVQSGNGAVRSRPAVGLGQLFLSRTWSWSDEYSAPGARAREALGGGSIGFGEGRWQRGWGAQSSSRAAARATWSLSEAQASCR
jgi:hypothetical protein